MIKKILQVILCLMLIFNISVLAATSENSTNANTSYAEEEMPMQNGGSRQGGGRGGMGMPPSMPDGEMPTDNMTPPQDSENTADGNTDITNDNTNHMHRGGMGGMEGMNGNTQNINKANEAQSQNGILEFVKNYSTPLFSVILLILAFIFVIYYKRKSY